MVKFDLEQGEEVAHCKEAAYREGAHGRDYCTSQGNELLLPSAKKRENKR